MIDRSILSLLISNYKQIEAWRLHVTLMNLLTDQPEQL